MWGTVTVLGSSPGDIAPALECCDLIVDALFGTGLGRALGEPFFECIARMNAAKVPRVALDVPSGLCADSGRLWGTCIDAHLTVTFGAPKLGLFGSQGKAHRGRLQVVDIGLGTEDFATDADAWLLEDTDLNRWITPRSVAAHKGTLGHVHVVAGSPGKTGAAWLAAYAALRAGAGRCTIVTDPATAGQLDTKVVELMTCGLEPDALPSQLAHASSVVVGPGLGTDRRAREFIDRVVFEWNGPTVVDADALTCFAGRPRDLRRAAGALILTPHPLELARLLAQDVASIECNRFEAVQRAAEETQAVVVLKGPNTLIAAPKHVPRVNDVANAALATAGAGDVLSGITGALLGHLPPLDAACAAVMLHGKSAQLWAAEFSGQDRGLLAREIADFVPRVIGRVLTSIARGGHPTLVHQP